jgi:hypothetical protein
MREINRFTQSQYRASMEGIVFVLLNQSSSLSWLGDYGARTFVVRQHQHYHPMSRAEFGGRPTFPLKTNAVGINQTEPNFRAFGTALAMQSCRSRPPVTPLRTAASVSVS